MKEYSFNVPQLMVPFLSHEAPARSILAANGRFSACEEDKRNFPEIRVVFINDKTVAGKKISETPPFSAWSFASILRYPTDDKA